MEFVCNNPYKYFKVNLDKNRMVQVCTNFATNAIKHTEKGRIVMGYEYLDGGLKIYVEDTGCGIPKDKQSRLFERFAKLDDFSQGNGLGLAICKAIADATDGEIGAESEVGKGSRFWIWLPCAAEISECGKADNETIGNPSYAETASPKPGVNKSAGKSVLVA